MTDIIELSNDVLTITYRVDLFKKLIYLVGGLLCLGFSLGIVITGGGNVSGSRFPALAVPFLGIMGIGFTAGAVFFVSGAFRRIDYNFDKVTDQFRVGGRRYFFRQWSAVGSVSEIVRISHDVRRTDENVTSEIHLTFRCYGSITETQKCGTGNESDDNHIADTIERFLKPAP